MLKTLYVYVGLETAEREAFLTCKHSIEKHATGPIKVIPIDVHKLRKDELFTREWLIKSNGQHICQVDNRPFSTQFSHTRFLVPELWRNNTDANKSSLAVFVDCDFVFLDDMCQLIKEIEAIRALSNHKAPVYCVKHDYNPEERSKMHGVEQYQYNMKLWTSFMVFDMEHPDNDTLTPDLVNSADGRKLHQFCWVKDINTIERIPEVWNYIPNHSEKNTPDKPSAIHFTAGGPWLSHLRNCRYASIWNDSFNEYVRTLVKDVVEDTTKLLDRS